MLTLWDRLTEIYGHAFTSQYGDCDGPAFVTWSRGLQGYTRDQIARGVGHCLKLRDAFPPNLGQFQELCLTDNRAGTSKENTERYLEHKPIQTPGVREREIARQAAIAKSSKSRDPHPNDAEDFQDSIRYLEKNAGMRI